MLEEREKEGERERERRIADGQVPGTRQGESHLAENEVELGMGIQ
jgi:dihydroxyacetone kinase